MVRFIFPFIVLLSITGCATTPSSSLGGQKSTQDRLGNALISPLSDLNIVQTAIPPIIQEALKNPYQITNTTSCVSLTEQIQQLDTSLGPDLDALVLRKEKTAVEMGQK